MHLKPRLPGTPRLVGVIGASVASPPLYTLARELGTLIAGRGWWVICGGLGGVMEAACRGAVESGGHTLGILPGVSRQEANPWVEVTVVTGLSEARNAVIARTAHAVVALPGSFGTLSEIAFCRQFGTPVVGLTRAGAGALPYEGLDIAAAPEQACDWVADHM